MQAALVLSEKRQPKANTMVSKRNEENSIKAFSEKTKKDTPSVQPRTFKVVVIGDTNVGKTCLVCRLCGGAFPVATETTIGVDFRERSMLVDGDNIKVRNPFLVVLF